MGEKDITEKLLEEHNDVFADIVNVLLFHGEKIVKEDSLTKTGDISQYKIENVIHEQERDVSKIWKKSETNMEDLESENGKKEKALKSEKDKEEKTLKCGKDTNHNDSKEQREDVVIAMYGLENQTEIDKEMPFRVIGYDGAKYRSQVNRTEKSKHFPVVTMVLYFGEQRWKKNKSLYEGMIVPKYLEPYVNDYKINVYEIAYLTEEQVEMFTSDFKIVADYFVQMRKNKDYQPSQETIRHVDEVLKLMSVLTKDNRFLKAQQEEKGKVKNMCEVLDRVENRGIAKGIEKGMAQGLTQGICATIQIAKSYGASKESLIEKIKEKYSLSDAEAKEKVNKYYS